jgi:ABC-type multidrug transport system fused ATPase/permease subunit
VTEDEKSIVEMIYTLLKKISATRIGALIVLILLINALEVLGLALFIPIIDLFQGRGGASGITHSLSRILSLLGLPSELATFLVLLSLLFLVKSGLIMWMRYVSVTMAAEMQNRLRLQLFRDFLGASTDFINGQKQGALLSVLSEHTVRTGQAFFVLVQIIAQWVTVLAYLGFVLWISWKLALVALVLGLGISPVIRWMGQQAHRHGKDYTQALEDTQHRALEGLQAKKLVNAMNWAPPLGKRFQEGSVAVRNHWQWMAFWSNSPGIVVQPISVVILSLIIWMSLHFDLSVALLGAFVLAFTRLLPNVQSAISMGADFQANKPSIDRVFGLLNMAAAACEPNGHTDFQGMQRCIKLEGVRYRHAGREPILNGLDLEILKGQTVALVGPSGSGKTTIADLILGLYRPEAGRLMIDDINLADMNLRQYRSHIAYVSQEAVLFHDTIRSNLTLGLGWDVSDDELRTACEKAGAWDFIVQRPGGLDAIIGDRGVQLSGGQRQRLALARALLRRPDILILDEATSALDHESERWITQMLCDLQKSGHFTIIVIAHRYTTIQHADQIYEIRNDGARMLGNWGQAKAYLMHEAQTLAIS